MDRVTHLAHNPAGLPQLHAIDGGPGTGKTTTLLDALDSPLTDGKRVAVVTYSVAAAQVVHQRVEERGLSGIDVGTLYALTWPGVKPFAGGKKQGRRGARPWNERQTKGFTDPMIQEFLNSAPGNRRYSPYERAARLLHSWDGEEDPPINIDRIQPRHGLQYALPVARWLRAEHPFKKPYDLIIMDETQDMSPLEVMACLGLLTPEGRALAFLDPGQAIFGNSKWDHAGVPPAWTLASERFQIQGGFRVGDPLASVAASVLNPVFGRDSCVFAKDVGTTAFLEWDGYCPARGLVLGLSRASVTRYALENGKKPSFALTAGAGDPDTEAVFSVVHSAKGFEADEVYLLEWSLPWLDRIHAQDPAALQILYVALTRGSKAVYVAPLLKTYIDACL